MKNIILFFVLIFSFNVVSAQNHITEIIPEPMIQQSCVAGESTFSFWQKQLMDPRITSVNTSIEVWKFFGSTYYLLHGEQGCRIDTWPLLVKVLPNGCWKVIKNFRDSYYDPTGQNYIISVSEGCLQREIDFFSNLNGNKGAEFQCYLWKKFPNDNYWKPKIQY